ncbi:MAG: four helix bundle protein [Bacteroidaceae bacterium]|jgi:four helix bundle protein|nr:four helix bundle protein [Bacteroidaceae bacterium]
MAYAFENLNAWKESRKLVVIVYQSLDLFPGFERYALCDQIRRSVVSVSSNIAEGSGRISTREQLHFYEISYGSLMETYNQLILAADLKYIGENDLNNLKPQIDMVARMLNGLRSSLLKKL